MQLSKTRFSPDVQIPVHQIEVIAAAIRARGPDCNLLVFGVGHDTGMWIDINHDGYTLFAETSSEWADKVSESVPEANVKLYDLPLQTVASSLETPLDLVANLSIPDFIAALPWDVIVIDGPPGFSNEMPGRAQEICWAGAVRGRDTHVFVHDYEREVEKLYSDLALRRPHREHAVISAHKGKRQLFWSIGLSTREDNEDVE